MISIAREEEEEEEVEGKEEEEDLAVTRSCWTMPVISFITSPPPA